MYCVKLTYRKATINHIFKIVHSISFGEKEKLITKWSFKEGKCFNPKQNGTTSHSWYIFFILIAESFGIVMVIVRKKCVLGGPET